MLKARSNKLDSKKSNSYILSVLLGLSLLSFIRLLDAPDYWIIDMLSHFPVQYALLALFILLICAWKKKISLAVFAGLISIFNMSVLLDLTKTVYAAGHEHSSFKVYSANINKSNTDCKKLVSVLSETGADILLLLEVTERNMQPLTSLIQSYPYRIVNLNVGSVGTGTVLLSKLPIINHSVTKYSEFGNMLVSALLEINNEKVAFYAVHFPKPTVIEEFAVRSKQFKSLAHQIKRQLLPVIVAGDFNATPYSPTFRQFLKITGLKDSRKGFGWLPSWPAYFPLGWIPIDHILVSSDIYINNRATGPYIGSDHFPIFAELSLG